MASELRVTTIANNAGSESVGTTYVINGSAKVWVNFNGQTTTTSRNSFNVSSLTDNGTGDTTVTVSNAFADADFSPLSGRETSTSQTRPKLLNMSTDTSLSTTVSRYLSVEGTSSATVADEDCAFNFVAIHGDLA
jgi:hypothetical protein